MVEASIADVREKAKRIRAEGGVRIIADQDGEIVAYVKGEHNVYQTSILRTPGSRQAIAAWTCFLPDAPVMMADGTEKPISKIEVGDLVVTHTGAVQRVAKVGAKPYTGDLTRVKVQGDPREIVATSTHQVYAANADYYLAGRSRDVLWRHTDTTVPALSPVHGWCAIGELVQGDYLSRSVRSAERNLSVTVPCPDPRAATGTSGVRGVRQSSAKKWAFSYKDGGRGGATVRHYFPTCAQAEMASAQHHARRSSIEVEIGPDLAYWLGWYTAEGCLVKDRYRVAFTLGADEQWVVERLNEISWKHFGVRGTARHVDNKIDYRVSHYALYHLAKALVGEGSRTKHLDAGVMNLPREVQGQFLAAWHSGDGCV
jgi:hypothetical protein